MNAWCKHIIVASVGYFVAMSGLLIAQPTNEKHSLGISTLNISNLSSAYFLEFWPITAKIGANAVYKKRLYEHVSYRFSQSYYEYKFNSGQTHQMLLREINTSGGFEYRYFQSKKKRLNLYTSLDITGFVNYSTSTLDYGYGIQNYVYKQRKIGLGLSPGIGLTIYPFRRMVLSIESSALAGISKNQQADDELSGFKDSSIPTQSIQAYSQIFLIRTASIGWMF